MTIAGLAPASTALPAGAPAPLPEDAAAPGASSGAENRGEAGATSRSFQGFLEAADANASSSGTKGKRGNNAEEQGDGDVADNEDQQDDKDRQSVPVPVDVGALLLARQWFFPVQQSQATAAHPASGQALARGASSPSGDARPLWVATHVSDRSAQSTSPTDPAAAIDIDAEAADLPETEPQSADVAPEALPGRKVLFSGADARKLFATAVEASREGRVTLPQWQSQPDPPPALSDGKTATPAPATSLEARGTGAGAPGPVAFTAEISSQPVPPPANLMRENTEQPVSNSAGQGSEATGWSPLQLPQQADASGQEADSDNPRAHVSVERARSAVSPASAQPVELAGTPMRGRVSQAGGSVPEPTTSSTSERQAERNQPQPSAPPLESRKPISTDLSPEQRQDQTVDGAARENAAPDSRAKTQRQDDSPAGSVTREPDNAMREKPSEGTKPARQDSPTLANGAQEGIASQAAPQAGHSTPAIAGEKQAQPVAAQKPPGDAPVPPRSEPTWQVPGADGERKSSASVQDIHLRMDSHRGRTRASMCKSSSEVEDCRWRSGPGTRSFGRPSGAISANWSHEWRIRGCAPASGHRTRRHKQQMPGSRFPPSSGFSFNDSPSGGHSGGGH